MGGFGDPKASPPFRKWTGALTFGEPGVLEADHTLCRHHW